MKIVITLGNKVLNIKDKTLLNKLAELINSSTDNIILENNYIPRGHNSIPGEKENLQSGSGKNIIPVAEQEGENPAAKVLEEKASILSYIDAAGEIAGDIQSGNNIQYNRMNGEQGNKNYYSNNRSGEAGNFKQDNSKGRIKTPGGFDQLINDMDKSVVSFTESAGNSFKKMWDGLISNGRKAKDPWDAVWLSLRNTAIKRIGEILKSDLFNDLLSGISGGGGSKGILGSIISGIAGFFSGGGVLAKNNLENYTPVSTAVVNTFNNYNTSYYTGREIVNSFTKYAEAAEKWQKELRVVNDLFENNRGIKTVHEYLNKIKS